ncbi:MAG: helix-turn-helix transcriptional regulator [Clostridia bacterium]|nr:helix-turn-helix transcriptional regulator [Clostridia bacterium]
MKNTRNSNDRLNIVGDKIRYYREKNNWSYQKLSDKLMILGIDIHKQSIYRIEKGLRTVVDYELCGFAKCFNISLETLVSEYMKDL